MRQRKSPSPSAIAAACEAQSIRPVTTARTWLIHWPNIEPTMRRYQMPVTLSRVLADHRAALAAEPVQETTP